MTIRKLNHPWVAIGCFLAFLSIALGAFVAHFLGSRIGRELVPIFQTGVQYQFYHAVALIALGVWSGSDPARRQNGFVRAAGYLFLAGVLLFCCSLYLLAVTGVREIGIITPVGGLAFMAGWLVFGWAAIKVKG